MAYFTIFAASLPLPRTRCYGYTCVLLMTQQSGVVSGGIAERFAGRVAQLVRALLSHSRGPGFESLRVHFRPLVVSQPYTQR
jgi:hypothetical protein